MNYIFSICSIFFACNMQRKIENQRNAQLLVKHFWLEYTHVLLTVYFPVYINMRYTLTCTVYNIHYTQMPDLWMAYMLIYIVKYIEIDYSDIIWWFELMKNSRKFAQNRFAWNKFEYSVYGQKVQKCFVVFFSLQQHV